MQTFVSKYLFINNKVKQLDDLNTSIGFDANDTYDIGTSSIRIKAVYTGVINTNTITASGEISGANIKANYVSGSVLFGDSSGNIAENNTSLFWDNANDRLGIGTNNPSEKLDVAGNVRLENGATSTELSIYATYTDASNYERLRTYFDGTEWRIETEQAGTGGNRNVVMPDTITIGKLIIDADEKPGNFGSALISPSSAASGSNRRSEIRLDAYSQSAAEAQQLVFKVSQDTNVASISTSAGGGGVNMPLHINTGGTKEIVLNSGGGNVGINNTAPTEKLDVTGNVRLENGATPTELTLYGTYTDASNYERLRTYFDGTYHTITSEAAGTGVNRDLRISVPTTRLKQVEVNDSVRHAGNSNLGMRLVNGNNTVELLGDSMDTPTTKVRGNITARNGTTPTELTLYGTYTDASNYERLRIYYDGTNHVIASESAGTGSTRNIGIHLANTKLLLEENRGSNVFMRGQTVNGFMTIFGGTNDDDGKIVIPSKNSLVPLDIITPKMVSDVAARELRITGCNSYSSATTNVDGGDITITPGSPATGGNYGNIIINNLPTTDPGVANALWNNGGFTSVSSTSNYTGLSYSLTWDDGGAGTTFTAIELNVTDTSSAADSKLIDLQVGGSSKFLVDKSGNVGSSSSRVGTLYLSGNIDVDGKLIQFNPSDMEAISRHITAGYSVGVRGERGNTLGMDRANISSTPDLALFAKGIMEARFGDNRTDLFGNLFLRNGTTPTELTLYGTYTDASNYERLRTYFNGTSHTIVSEAAGTGVVREIKIDAGGANGLEIKNTNTGTNSYAIVIPNGAWYTARNSGGSSKRLFSIGSNDNVYMGDIDGTGGTYLVIRSAGTDAVLIDNSQNSSFAGNVSGKQVNSTSFVAKNGTTPTELTLYGTYADASNYERLRTHFDGTQWIIETESAGTGVVRNIKLDAPRILFGGEIRTGGGSSGDPILQVGQDNMGFYREAANRLGVSIGGTRTYLFRDTHLEVQNGKIELTTLGGGNAVKIQRSGTRTLTIDSEAVELKDGLNPQSLSIYGTYTDASNYERLRVHFDGSTYFIDSESAGTGGNRNIKISANEGGNLLLDDDARIMGGTGGQAELGSNGSIRWTVLAGGDLDPANDNVFDIGRSPRRVKDIYVGSNIYAEGASLVTGDITAQNLTLGSGGNYATEMSVPTSPTATATSGGTLASNTYYFKIVATDGVGTTVGSTEVSATVDGSTTTAIDVSWTGVTGASSYRIYVGTSSGGQDQYYTSTTTSYTLTSYTSDTDAVPTVTTAYVNKISANGNSWMLGGNVGIGTTNPGGLLEVFGSGNGRKVLVNTSGNLVVQRDRSSGGAGALLTLENLDNNNNSGAVLFEVKNSNYTFLKITETVSVGSFYGGFGANFGSEYPGNSSAGTSHVFYGKSQSHSSGTSEGVRIDQSINASSTARADILQINLTDNGSGSGGNYLIAANTGASEKFSVQSDGTGYFAGNVGIGTTSPSETLDVAGNVRLENGATSTELSIYATYTDASNYERLRAYFNGTNHVIGSEAAGTGVVRNFEFAGGKVGIGTSPSTELDVTGSANISSDLTVSTALYVAATSFKVMTSNSTGYKAILIGDNSGGNGSGKRSIAIGSQADATAEYALALGRLCRAQGVESTAIGWSSFANKEGSIAIGGRCQADAIESIVIGRGYGGSASQQIINTVTKSVLLGTADINGVYHNLHLHPGGLSVFGGDVKFNKAATYDAEFSNGNSGTSATVNWGEGNKQSITLTGNVTISFTDPVGACNLLIKITQDATGGRTITWPANVKWPGGTQPSVTSAASAVDIASFYFDGTDYYGQLGNNFS